MMTVTTNFGTEEQLKEAMIAGGRTVVEDEKPPVEKKPAKPEEKPSEQPAKPGEETPVAAAGSEATPPTDAGEKKTQEPSQAAPPEPKPTQGFKSKAEKAQALVDRLTQDLELERGSKTGLQAKLEAAEAELARLRPVAPPVADAGPVRPKRPTRAEHDFDDTAYEAAMDTYEGAMETYRQQMTQRDVDKAITDRDEKARAKDLEAKQNQAYNDWVRRRDEGAKHYGDDWTAIFEALPPDADFPPDSAARMAIFEAENPADLMVYFARDVLDNGSKELNRISGLGPVAQVREITRLEERLVADRSKPPVSAPPPPPPAAAAPPPAKLPESVPAKPRPTVKVPEPIETLGSRSAGAPKRDLRELAAMADAGDGEARKEYFRRRSAGEQ